MITDKRLEDLTADFADIIDGLLPDDDNAIKFILILACPIDIEKRIATSVVSNFKDSGSPVLVLESIVKSHKKGDYKECSIKRENEG